MQISTLKVCLSFLIGVVSCKNTEPPASSLAVFDGTVVTRPDQSPGVYKVLAYDAKGNVVGGASGVMTSSNTLITNGHVYDQVKGASRVAVQDYLGREVSSFDPSNANEVTAVVNRGYTPTRQDVDPATLNRSDVAAFVLKNPAPASTLTHGTIPVAQEGLKPGAKITLTGMGASDPAFYDRPYNPDDPTRTGILRTGTNKIEATDGNAGYFISTPGAVSLGGDSGGGVSTLGVDGRPVLAGIMQGPAYASQPGQTGSFLVNLSSENSSQDQFREDLGKAGGNLAGPRVEPINETLAQDQNPQSPEVANTLE